VLRAVAKHTRKGTERARTPPTIFPFLFDESVFFGILHENYLQALISPRAALNRRNPNTASPEAKNLSKLIGDGLLVPLHTGYPFFSTPEVANRCIHHGQNFAAMPLKRPPDFYKPVNVSSNADPFHDYSSPCLDITWMIDWQFRIA